jgi:hypothetical protein
VWYDRLLLSSQCDAIRWALFIEAAHAIRAGWTTDAQCLSYLTSIRGLLKAASTIRNGTDSQKCRNGQSESECSSNSSTGNSRVTPPSSNNSSVTTPSSLFAENLNASSRLHVNRYLALCRKTRFWNAIRFRNCHVQLDDENGESTSSSHGELASQHDIVADVSVSAREMVIFPTDVNSAHDERVFRISRIHCWRIQLTVSCLTRYGSRLNLNILDSSENGL